jgi:uncharacterized protein (TIGR01244 family)
MNAIRHSFLFALLALAFAANAGDILQPRPGLHTSGQPTLEQLDTLAAQGVHTVIDLRGADEDRGYDEAAELKSRGMAYHSLPINGKDDLNADNAAALKRLLDASGGDVLIHCHTGNRAGALLALMAAKDEGLAPEKAMELGKNAGMTSLAPVVEEKLGLTPASTSTPSQIQFSGFVRKNTSAPVTFNLGIPSRQTAVLQLADGSKLELATADSTNTSDGTRIRFVSATGKVLHTATAPNSANISFAYLVCKGRVTYISPVPNPAPACPAE